MNSFSPKTSSEVNRHFGYYISLRRSLGLVHWDDPEGWDEEGGGTEGQDGELMYTHDGFKSMYCKTNTIL